MPRLVFENSAEFKGWIQNKVEGEKYDCFVTSTREIILVPTKSTPPIMYGYYHIIDAGAGNEVIRTVKSKGVSVFKVKNFEWKTDSPIGAVYREKE